MKHSLTTVAHIWDKLGLNELTKLEAGENQHTMVDHNVTDHKPRVTGSENCMCTLMLAPAKVWLWVSLFV